MAKLIRTASATAPATVANVGPGFDVFGFAISGPGDVVIAREDDAVSPLKARIGSITGDGGALSHDPDRNVVTTVAMAMLRANAVLRPGTFIGVTIDLVKGLPIGSGLGSSSASAVAAAVAMNRLLDDPFTFFQQIDFAREGERVACGSAHADNVSAAFFGGFSIAGDPGMSNGVRVPVPREWRVAVVHPHLGLETRQARSVLPRKVTLEAMTNQVANAARLIHALHFDDLDLFAQALRGDAVVVPARRSLIQGYYTVERAALGAGAAAVSISGAGPSMFAVCASEAIAEAASAAMAAAWGALGIESDPYVSPMGTKGAMM
ncbi:MAG: hypothetical protein RLZZ324_540 [Candidatus Parcubacteria bacterium]|jgi:homoserine kinase